MSSYVTKQTSVYFDYLVALDDFFFFFSLGTWIPLSFANPSNGTVFPCQTATPSKVDN